MKKKLIVMSLLISVAVMATEICTMKSLDFSKTQKSVEKNEDKKTQMGAPMNKKVITEDMITNKTENGYNLNFDANKNYTTKTATVNGKPLLIVPMKI